MCSSSLELIIGPMFAGKSTELIKKIKMYNILEKNVLIINHIINNRYGNYSNYKYSINSLIQKFKDLK